MSAPKFKVGDRVRLVRDTDDGKLKAGAIGTVQEAGSWFPWVEWDGLRSGNSGPFADGRKSYWAVRADDLRKIESPTAESLLLALGKAAHEVEAALEAEREAEKSLEDARLRVIDAREARHRAEKAIREAAYARAA